MAKILDWQPDTQTFGYSARFEDLQKLIHDLGKVNTQLDKLEESVVKRLEDHEKWGAQFEEKKSNCSWVKDHFAGLERVNGMEHRVGVIAHQVTLLETQIKACAKAIQSPNLFVEFADLCKEHLGAIDAKHKAWMDQCSAEKAEFYEMKQMKMQCATFWGRLKWLFSGCASAK